MDLERVFALAAARPAGDSTGLQPQWDLPSKFWILRGKLAPERYYRGLGPVTVAGRELSAAELRAALESVARAERGEDCELSGLAAVVDDYLDVNQEDREDRVIAALVADLVGWIETAPPADTGEGWMPDLDSYAMPEAPPPTSPGGAGQTAVGAAPEAVAVEVAPPTSTGAGFGYVRKGGSLRPILCNAAGVLANAPEWHRVIGFNQFTLDVEMIGPAPWCGAKPGSKWGDSEDRQTAIWLQQHEVQVSDEVAGKAVQVIARDNPFHPVRDFLDSLRWDGVRRLDTWTTDCLGVAPTPFAAAVGSRWLISAVARVRVPGAKCDHVLVLEGRQGIGKTRTFEILGGEFYTDSLAEMGSKDAALQLAGKWVIELSELESLARSDVERAKAFLSRTTDRYRPPYGRHVLEVPRQCVFGGSVNRSDYLRDDANRRFWPLACAKIDLCALERDRDQLWAEADHRFKAGERWWLDTEALAIAASTEQEQRVEADPWDRPVENVLAELESTARDRARDELQASTCADIDMSHILTFALAIPLDRQTRAHEMRAAKIFRRLGWSRQRCARTAEGTRPWTYRKRVEVGPTTRSDAEVGT
jgi:predicted P-loop ATPase